MTFTLVVTSRPSLSHGHIGGDSSLSQGGGKLKGELCNEKHAGDCLILITHSGVTSLYLAWTVVSSDSKNGCVPLTSSFLLLAKPAIPITYQPLGKRFREVLGKR